MNLNINQSVPVLSSLPVSLPREGAIEIELEQGVLIFRVSSAVQNTSKLWSRKSAIHNSHRTRLKSWNNMKRLMII
jgi:hypothetical protein